MKKDFNQWNEIKKETDGLTKYSHCNVGEVWWCRLGINIGSEQNGSEDSFLRPVLIFHKVSSDILWVFPLSTKIKDNKYRFLIKKLQSQVLLSQVRTVSSKRIIRKMSRLSKKEVSAILKIFISVLH